MAVGREAYLILAIISCVVGGIAQAQQRPTTSDDGDELQSQIQELRSGSFADREQAARELANAGEPSVPLLESTVASDDDFEARLRSMELLRQIYEAHDFAASFAAGDALRRLALHQQELVSSFATDALESQYGLAVERLKKKGAVFASRNRTVELGESWRGDSTDVLDIRWLKGLQTLRISKPDLTDETLVVLRWVRNLPELVVLDAAISDAGLLHLKHVPDLKILHLARTNVTDNGIQHLLRLSSLYSLDLSGSKVTADGAAQLPSLKKLKYLDLRGLPITDEQLEPLRRVLPDAHILIDRPAVP